MPGQFRDLDEIEQWRRYPATVHRDEGRRVLRAHGNTDVTPPTITSTSAAIIGGAGVCSVQATDNAAVTRVNVIYTTDVDGGDWHSLDLPLVGGVYAGGHDVTDGATQVDYFVQVVDSGGNVSVSSHKGANFAATVELTPPPPPSAPIISLPPTSTPGQYDGDVVVTVAPGSAGGPVNTTVNGGPPTTATSIIVTGSDVYTVVSTGPDGESSVVRFFIGSIAAPPTPPTASAVTATPAPPERVVHDIAGQRHRHWYAWVVAGRLGEVPGRRQRSVHDGARRDGHGARDGPGPVDGGVRVDRRQRTGERRWVQWTCASTPSPRRPRSLRRPPARRIGSARSSTPPTRAPMPLLAPVSSGAVERRRRVNRSTRRRSGTKTFTVTSIDVAGNTRQTPVTYTVSPGFAPVPTGSFTRQPAGPADVRAVDGPAR